MQREEPKPEDLLLVDEVSDERAGESGARGTSAACFEWPRITRVARVAQVHLSCRRQCRARPRSPRRKHAVEHVDARRDDAENPLRIAEPHEIPWPVVGEERRTPGDGLQHLFLALTDGEAPQRVSIEPERDDLLDRSAPELRVRSALRDPEPQLTRGPGCADLPLCPERGSPDRELVVR